MIDNNIKMAATPPGDFYLSEERYAEIKEKIFARSWQLIGDEHDFADNDHLYPVKFMDGCLNEPLLLHKDEDGNSELMSNVCTHRGYILVDTKMAATLIKCRYHGRCFNADG